MTTDPLAPPVAPAALAEPAVPVRGRWIALLVLANLGVWMAFFTPIQVLLPQQIKAIDPVHKEAMLGWVTAFGAAAAVVVNPLAGALSDRTTWRYGRRHGWTVAGAVFGAAALVVLSRQHTVLGVAVGWVAAQTGFNAMLATLTAAVPDRVPVAQRGAVSGWVGIPQVLGLVLGVVLVTALITGNAAGYVAVAVAVVLLALPFALTTPDDPLPRGFRAGPILAGLWVSPRRYPDFAWAWITRFLVQLGNALGTLYLLYFLTDRVHHPDPEKGLLVLILIYTAALAATTVRRGRRGAHHAGAAEGHRPGQGPRRGQHRQLRPAGPRAGAVRADRGAPRRVPHAVRRHRRGHRPRQRVRAAHPQRPLAGLGGISRRPQVQALEVYQPGAGRSQDFARSEPLFG